MAFEYCLIWASLLDRNWRKEDINLETLFPWCV